VKTEAIVMSADTLIQFLILIVMLIELATKTGKS
jgi:hypothetical protein